MIVPLKNAIRSAFNKRGFQIVPTSQHPVTNFMNLRSLGIDTVLDIGANAGQFATRIHRVLPEAAVHSFEPLPGVFPLLEETFRREGISGKCHPFALGNEDKTEVMHLHVEHSPSSSILPTTEFHRGFDERTRETREESIEIRRLDGLASTLGLSVQSRILIKMDVQGFEKNVILGGMETFGRSKAVLTEICLDPLYEGQPSFAELHDMFTGLGLRYAGNYDQWQQGDGRVVCVDALYVAE